MEVLIFYASVSAFRPFSEDGEGVLFTLLHPLAHSRCSIDALKGVSDWSTNFVRLGREG